MKKLLVITGNKNKFLEISHFLATSSFLLEQCNLELEEIQSLDPKVVIEHKTEQALKAGYTNFILEDTSLFIDGLNRLPGTLIKWFLEELKPAGIYKLAQAMGSTEAVAKTIFAYVDDTKKAYYFEGVTHGHIVSPIVSPTGTTGFGWSALFKPINLSKTYAELTLDEKQQCSQRAQALKKLLNFLDAS